MKSVEHNLILLSLIEKETYAIVSKFYTFMHRWSRSTYYGPLNFTTQKTV